MNAEMTYEERGTDLRWMKKLLFAGVFIQENRLHTIFDRYNEMSSKQWLLMVICNSFDTTQDLTTLGAAMGCSRQNVKKLALQLEKNGYVVLEKSKKDARSLCVKGTEKGIEFAKKNEALVDKLHETVFKEFTDEEIEKYYQMSIKMMHGIEYLEEFFKSAEKEKEEML